MVVITSIATANSLLHHDHRTHIYTLTCKPLTTSLLYFRHLYTTSTNSNICRSSNGVLVIKSYMEDSNTISGFANKIIGAFPVVGLVARILTDTDGVGGDSIDFAEFRWRVGKNSSVNDSRAFIDFQDRRGRKCAKLNAPVPAIPMEARAEKALDAIYVCCFGRDPIEEEDEGQLCIMLKAIFPSVAQHEIDRIVKAKVLESNHVLHQYTINC